MAAPKADAMKCVPKYSSKNPDRLKQDETPAPGDYYMAAPKAEAMKCVPKYSFRASSVTCGRHEAERIYGTTEARVQENPQSIRYGFGGKVTDMVEALEASTALSSTAQAPSSSTAQALSSSTAQAPSSSSAAQASS